MTIYSHTVHGTFGKLEEQPEAIQRRSAIAYIFWLGVFEMPGRVMIFLQADP